MSFSSFLAKSPEYFEFEIEQRLLLNAEYKTGVEYRKLLGVFVKAWELKGFHSWWIEDPQNPFIIKFYCRRK